jgi:hypothetical protein
MGSLMQRDAACQGVEFVSYRSGPAANDMLVCLLFTRSGNYPTKFGTNWPRQLCELVHNAGEFPLKGLASRRLHASCVGS